MTNILTGRSSASIDEFAKWRAERPFWGGVLLLVAGLVIGWPPVQFSVELLPTGEVYAIIGLVFAMLVFAAGIAALWRPKLSTRIGIAGIAVSLLSLVGALGGYGIGLLLGVIGGALCIAWRSPSGPDGSNA